MARKKRDRREVAGAGWGRRGVRTVLNLDQGLFLYDSYQYEMFMFTNKASGARMRESVVGKKEAIVL